MLYEYWFLVYRKAYMENYHSAFLPGEYVKIRSQSELIRLQKQFGGDAENLGLHTVIPEDMASHADKRVKISNVSYYHFGWVLYELEELPRYWPEAAIVDQCFDKADVSMNQPANLTYVAVKSEDNKFVNICDQKGQICCSMRKHDVGSAVNDINRVAALRSRIAFAHRYNFDDEEYF
ncbi:hypothetical protein [Desulfonema ishimotonii]|uniref:hypothetical protein n=1 Tax=Desulfonema ishimotonii TaxID=45657 RepID=UPI000F588D3B|nr:hypothetical protein [Desulfonema ishimotonii]